MAVSERTTFLPGARRLFLPALLAAWAVAVLFHFIWLAALRVPLDYPTEYQDGLLPYHVSRILSGGPIYPDWSGLPCCPLPYTPLYYLVCALFPGSGHPGVLFGRVLVSLSALGIAAALAWIVAILTRRPVAALASAAAFLGSVPLLSSNARAFADMPAWCLAFWAAALAFATPRQVLLPSILLIAAFFTKQPAILLAPAVFAVTAASSQANRRRALAALVATLVAVVAISAIADALSDGRFFSNIIRANAATFELGASLRQLGQINRTDFAFTVTAIGALAALAGSRPLRPAILFALYSMPLALLSGKMGSGLHYFVPWSAAVALLFGFAVDYVMRFGPGRSRLALPAAVAVAALINAARIPSAARRELTEARAIGTIDRQIIRELSAAHGDVLCELPGLTVYAGKKLWVDTFVAAELSRHGVWDESPFIEAIRRGDFSLIATVEPIAERDDWSAAAAAAIRETYREYKRIGPWLLLKPRSPSATASSPNASGTPARRP